ncbi:MAG: assimilatory sulfite reductase (NADPH) hemoprotein subunit [Xanthomonadales bacterium]|nr:assimilatory sulfite reductase (NADPH) hemoprotein subunit [Xanthomonadales bacterium]
MSTDVERIKAASRGLRGTLSESLAAPLTGAIAPDDTQLSKFHGIYQQDDRDLRLERQHQKLEPAWQFMIRARVPAGVCTADQWLALSQLAREHADGSLRLTTRQAFQLHGVLKRDLKPTIQAINKSLLDTIAACGDVNRNVMASPNPWRSDVHAQVTEAARAISDHLTPATRAYHEIWLDGDKLVGEAEAEPIYGATYLPRKFKIALAVPPENDVDVFAQDLGFIAIVRDGALLGYNVTAGGGMGATHGDPTTYPRLADVLGFCAPDEVVGIAEAVVTIQRDHGNRDERKRARLKYTIDDRGLDWFLGELAERRGRPLKPAAEFVFQRHTDRIGWTRGEDGRWHRSVFVQNGRIAGKQLAALDRIAESHRGPLLLTPNQNLIIASVAEKDRTGINRLLEQGEPDGSPLRQAAMACVAMPTCGLAMAEAERYLPDLIGKVSELFAEVGQADTDTVIRMTGCPNGCARPYLAEIGLVGKAPGKYNLRLGGDGKGQRLNRAWRDNLDEGQILEALGGLIRRWAAERDDDERFGDWTHRHVDFAAP